MKTKISLFIVGVMAITQGVFASVDLEWYNGSGVTPALDRTGATVVSDPVGNQPLVGALFQLIRSVNSINEVVQLGELGSGDGIGGGSDDVVLWTSWAGQAAVGDGFMSESIQTFASLQLSEFIYIRIWEDASPGATSPPNVATPVPGGDTAYWDTTPVLVSTLPVGGIGNRTYDFASSTQNPTLAYDGGVHSGAWVVIPEPSVLAFLGIGGLVVAVRRRMQKA